MEYVSKFFFGKFGWKIRRKNMVESRVQIFWTNCVEQVDVKISGKVGWPIMWKDCVEKLCGQIGWKKISGPIFMENYV